MDTVTGGNTAEYVKDRLLEDIRELKTLYKTNEDRALIGRTKDLVEEAAKGDGETRKRFEKALGVSIEDILAVKDSKLPSFTHDPSLFDLQSKIRNGSDVDIGYSIGRECYMAHMDCFDGWQEAFGDALKFEDDSYFGGTFRIWLTNESSGRCTTIRLRSNKGSYAAEAVEKLIELRQVPVGI